MERAGTSTQAFECAGVRCADDRLREMDGDRIVVSVAREDVRSLAWHYGLRAPHPVMQVCFGLALASVGYVPLRFFLKWLAEGGTFFTAVAFLVPVPCI